VSIKILNSFTFEAVITAHILLLIEINRGAWVAQSIERLRLAQVMIPNLASGPMSGSLLGGEPSSPSPSVTPPACALSQIKKKK